MLLFNTATVNSTMPLTLAAGCGLGVLLCQLLSIGAGRQSHSIVVAGGGTAALLLFEENDR
jgi:hypothetical protein